MYTETGMENRSLLAQQQVVSCLLRRRLLDESSIVDDELSVVDTSRHNQNFKLIRKRKPHFLVKQGIGPERVATVDHEAHVYRILSSGNRRIRAYLPRFYGYDEAEHALILELLPNAQNLREYHLRHGNISVALARAMGAALATLHLARPGNGKPDPSLQALERDPPWVLFIHQPALRILREISGANFELIKILQGSKELCDCLDALRREWKPDRLIHFDIKLDNWLAFGETSKARKLRLKLVDWELAGLGDPCWDVGSAFMDYLSLWLLSIPITMDTPLERFPELARHPLPAMHAPIRSFWHSYARHMNLDVATSDEWLVRAAKYAAARLIQTAFEQAQTSVRVNGNIRCMLQVGMNILRRPREAIVHLLGIPLSNLRLA